MDQSNGNRLDGDNNPTNPHRTPTTTTDDNNTPLADSNTIVAQITAKVQQTKGDEVLCSDDASSPEELIPDEPPTSFMVIYNKKKLPISLPLSQTVFRLKQEIEKLSGVPPPLQKIIIKGCSKMENDQLLRDCGIEANSRIMCVGSTLDDVLTLDGPPQQTSQATSVSSSSKREPLSQQAVHRKIIEKGPPDDVMTAVRGIKEPLPPYPLSGMLTKSGGKVRLTFKLELDQVWIGTKERTQKLPMTSVREIISEPIEGFEEYHIMALQLGPTEASRLWIYWVPAQYVDAIRHTILYK